MWYLICFLMGLFLGAAIGIIALSLLTSGQGGLKEKKRANSLIQMNKKSSLSPKEAGRPV